jgi:inactivated superfamily I helicase
MITFTEIENIVQNWKVLNLESLFDDLVPISLCLQTQMKYNENNKELSPAFRRISIPLVIRAFRESKAYKRNQFVNYFEECKSEECKPQVAMFKTKFKAVENVDLQKEANLAASLASEIAKEIDSLFSDVMNEEITFHGLGCLNDGTMTLLFNR